MSVLVNEGANGDVELAFSIVTEVADGSGVEPSRDGFEFGDDFGGAFFGGAGDGSSGEAGGEGGESRVFWGEGAADGGDEVVDVLEFFELKDVGDFHGAVLADLPEVIAQEVGDHDEFSAFFFGVLEVVGGLGIAGGIWVAWASAFDGAGFDLVSSDVEEGFGGGGEDFAAVEV